MLLVLPTAATPEMEEQRYPHHNAQEDDELAAHAGPHRRQTFGTAAS